MSKIAVATATYLLPAMMGLGSCSKKPPASEPVTRPTSHAVTPASEMDSQPDSSTSQPATASSESITRLSLREISGLKGGFAIYISGNGKTTVSIIKPGEASLVEERFVLNLKPEDMREISNMVANRKPDVESETFSLDANFPVIHFLLSSGRGGTFMCTECVQCNPPPGFELLDPYNDPVRNWLVDKVEKSRQTPPIFKGKFDYTWWPEGFPKKRAEQGKQ